ncbi:alpha/beta fold hydrolase [Streptomyces sp. YIM 98790]|uniref:alpha/beta fold hydrolase n=1 Tax=Streptomyces sp. YIM 98790 TaxID=2689077 RepID=UPI001407FD11|nr:alpha/beta fold hydrolase [Streptomyces sp. YIM 98790]
MPPHEALGARVSTLTYRGYTYCARVTPSRQAPRTEPVLLLGGILQDKDSWRLYELGITDWAGTVTFDLPGLGAADDLPADHGVDFLTDALRHALDCLGMPSVNVVGYSYGALIAHEFAYTCASRVVRLALAGIRRADSGMEQAGMDGGAVDGGGVDAADPGTEELRALDRMLTQGGWDAFAPRAADLLTRMEGVAGNTRSGAVRRLVARQFLTLPADRVEQYRTNLERLRHALTTHGTVIRADRSGAALQVPVLLFTGEGDALTPPHELREYARGFSDARVITIGNSGHMVMLERAEECIDLLRRFFTDAPVEDLSSCTGASRAKG